jgi:hypothetical protein
MAPVGKPLKHDIPARLFRLNRIRELRLTNCVGFSWNTELGRKPRCRIVNPFKSYKINIPNSTKPTGPHSVKLCVNSTNTNRDCPSRYFIKLSGTPSLDVYEVQRSKLTMPVSGLGRLRVRECRSCYPASGSELIGT